MAHDNKINLPSSGGGIMRYSDEASSKFKIKPQHVLVIIALIVIIELLLQLYGKALFGLA